LEKIRRSATEESTASDDAKADTPSVVYMFMYLSAVTKTF